MHIVLTEIKQPPQAVRFGMYENIAVAARHFAVLAFPVAVAEGLAGWAQRLSQKVWSKSNTSQYLFVAPTRVLSSLDGIVDSDGCVGHCARIRCRL